MTLPVNEPQRPLSNDGASALNESFIDRFLIGDSSPMQTVGHVVRLIAAKRTTVLITGESGTGKEVIARSLHALSGRTGSFVAVNCGALPAELLEAELFGHVKGAFTGAVTERVGYFEEANNGTIFLDEIGELPMPLQSKLLRVLQEREVTRLGSTKKVKLNTRVIAATNSNLQRMIRDNQFREDLYFRLNVVPIQMPPLRERREDIPALVVHFIEKICGSEGIERKRIGSDVCVRLQQHQWPGNVRELENAVELAIALSGDREELFAFDFPVTASASPEPPKTSGETVVVCPEGIDYYEVLSRFERSLLSQALNMVQGNKRAAANLLNLNRSTFMYKMKSLDLDFPELSECAA